MNIILIGEDHKDGLRADWPTVPRVGELVAFRYRGGTTVQKVTSVQYECDERGNVRLTY